MRRIEYDLPWTIIICERDCLGSIEYFFKVQEILERSTLETIDGLLLIPYSEDIRSIMVVAEQLEDAILAAVHVLMLIG